MKEQIALNFYSDIRDHNEAKSRHHYKSTSLRRTFHAIDSKAPVISFFEIVRKRAHPSNISSLRTDIILEYKRSYQIWLC